MSASTNRARVWIERLAEDSPQAALGTASILTAEVILGEGSSAQTALALAVVDDPASRLPRAAHGELGLEQAWTLAACLHEFIAQNAAQASARPILIIVDTPGQAFGSFEEQRCISVACAAAVDAYAAARRAGHPVITLVVGRAISGSFLAHGMQSDHILALTGDNVMMHAMSVESIARITRRSTAEIKTIADTVLPMSYAIEDAHRLGIIDTLIPGTCLNDPSRNDLARVKSALAEALAKGRRFGKRTDLSGNAFREATQAVQRIMQEQWRAADADDAADAS